MRVFFSISLRLSDRIRIRFTCCCDPYREHSNVVQSMMNHFRKERLRSIGQEELPLNEPDPLINWLHLIVRFWVVVFKVLIAIARKVIVLARDGVQPMYLFGIVAIVVASGITYALVGGKPLTLSRLARRGTAD